ncbi:TIGR03862 family flavoprotein [bacterium]|nr:TIGR03862 family flavoprotein [bacterium]QQR57719.1 MAG: TIGR03862 family flavoprotein [Candidatus Melainabacteria bacterium]
MGNDLKINCKNVAIVGGGPAGLMAAEVLIEAGLSVDVYESMPTLGRKFLRAGLGGLNITHSEPYERFCTRYDDKQKMLQKYLDSFPPDALRDWVHNLGIKTFVGTSGRVFPTEMKAAPLLRAWIHRLRNAGVNFYFNHRWCGFSGEFGNDTVLNFETPTGLNGIKSDAFILALGGASWPQLGSTGAWAPWLKERGIDVAMWQSANCGFEVAWTKLMQDKFAGEPLKAISLTFTGLDGVTQSKKGELLIKEYGVEGSLIYAFSKQIREYMNTQKEAVINIDLLPEKSFNNVLKALMRPRGSRSISRHLQNCIGDNALKKALLFETLSKDQIADMQILAKTIKSLPIRLLRPRPIEEAISSAGGVTFASVDDNLMLKSMPGIFVAGEMLDWEAPTGGYLLTACFATGRAAGMGVKKWLDGRD